MAFFVYVLKCGDGSYYTGHTDNLEKRFSEHLAGKFDGCTAARHPLKLVFSQMFPSRYEVLCAERQIKNWSRKKKEALVNKDWNQISKFTKKDFTKDCLK